MKKLTAHVEYTDTFNGEANYCWVRRQSFDATKKSTLGIVRTAKRMLGLNGTKATVYDHGDMIEIRPHNINTVAFINFE